MKHINRILIANRSEIAQRIQHTAHALEIETVIIYTSQDAISNYVAQATYAVQLPNDDPKKYLCAETLINIALQHEADAIHPGYGFLSESAEFAQQVADAGLIWVGPSPKSIALMADKASARLLAQQHNIPVTPGAHVDAQSYTLAQQKAHKIGFPVLIKCAHGGGGKAMRIAHSPDEFETHWNSVISESKRLFLSETILLEKYIPQARHIEVQIIGDGSKCIHAYDRECSIQRNNQKIIEEAPAISIPSSIREQLFTYACTIGSALNYCSVGTVEFMVTPNHEIFFLEVNTRLQVEHGVTELITGLDLVLLQFEIAQTNKLPITQSDVLIHGHSIQARIYAENPRNNFAPSTGILNYVEFASHHNGRIEETLSDGVLITPHFDPMIAKVLGRGQIREEARKTIVYLLSNTIISGIDTNIDLLLHILTREQYKKNNVHTKSIQSFLESFPIKNTGTKTIGIEALALGATVLTREAPTQQTAQTPASSRWKEQLWKT